MGVVRGLDGTIERVDDVVVLFQADVEVESVALPPREEPAEESSQPEA
jgi:hypothetical protein